MEERGHVPVHRGQDLGFPLHEADLETAIAEGLGQLEADEARPDHGGPAHVLLVDPLQDRVHVGNGPEGEDAGKIDAGDGRHDGLGTGREDEGVVGEAALLLRVEVDHGDDLLLRIHRGGLASHPHVEAEALPEIVGRVEDQALPLLDLPAHVIGQSAVGEAHVGALLDHDDLGLLVEPPGPNRCGRPARHSADDDDAAHLLVETLLHRSSSSVETSNPRHLRRQAQRDRRPSRFRWYRCRFPSTRRSTTSAVRRTRRCWLTRDWATSSRSWSSPTEASPSTRQAKMRRRRGWPKALRVSAMASMQSSSGIQSIRP